MILALGQETDTAFLHAVPGVEFERDGTVIVSPFAEHVHAEPDPHLLLAGPDVRAVTDDQESAEVFAEAEAAWHDLPPDVRSRVHLAFLPMEDAVENAVIVNACSDVPTTWPRRASRRRASGSRLRRRCGKDARWWRRGSAASRTRSKTAAAAASSTPSTSARSAST